MNLEQSIAHSGTDWKGAGLLNRRKIIALTGGPGGGKSTLIEELRKDPDWSGQFVALPETIQYARFATISPLEKLFQRAMVHIQMAIEDGLDRALGSDDKRFIICHRGSLDPLAYWLQRGWPQEEFFDFTGTSPEEHYRRYCAVIHLVTAADGACAKYTRWPDAHRPETPEEAVCLDRRLGQAWQDHPSYFRLDNANVDWQTKSAEARNIIASKRGAVFE